jgi:hypothetical protein
LFIILEQKITTWHFKTYCNSLIIKNLFILFKSFLWDFFSFIHCQLDTIMLYLIITQHSKIVSIIMRLNLVFH